MKIAKSPLCHPEKKHQAKGLCVNCYNVKRYKDNKERLRERQRNNEYKVLYGININQYNKILNEQNNVCAICKGFETARDNRSNNLRRLSVDHCHETGKIRGLLCKKCNSGLGYFRECLEIVNNASKYLEEFEYANKRAKI